jgi:tRNA modification GTPase
LEERKTIFALSTPRGRGAIAIIRVSGPSAGAALQALGGTCPPPRLATLMRLRDPVTGDVLDRALCLWFPAPGTFTGEDLAEFQIHGGRAVIEGVLATLAALPDLAPAEPGAFTRRAYRNGRLDLTAAEGLADLIEAETEAQRRQALKAADGALARLVEDWRTQLRRAMALVAANIDFPDEELPLDMMDGARDALFKLNEELIGHLAKSHQGERLRQGFRVALVGAPNVGKSSLLNALGRRDVAIVTDRPGTTRDILEIHLELGGYPVIVADMAGLRETTDAIESIGIARAETRAKESDLRLLLVEASETVRPLPEALACLGKPDDIILLTKSDLVRTKQGDGLAISSLSGQGIAELLALLEARAIQGLGTTDAPVFSRLRQRHALSDCQATLARAIGQWQIAPPELLAEDLRRAANALGRLTGTIDVEELLDTIFGEFCIGK